MGGYAEIISYVCCNTAEDKCIKIHVISEREEYADAF